jgi:hypothetical protein
MFVVEGMPRRTRDAQFVIYIYIAYYIGICDKKAFSTIWLVGS